MNSDTPDCASELDAAAAISAATTSGYLDIGAFNAHSLRVDIAPAIETWVTRCRAKGCPAPFLGLAETVWFVAVTMPTVPSETEVDRLCELLTVHERLPLLDVPDVTTWHTRGIDSYAEAVEVARRVAEWSGTPANRRWAVAKGFCSPVGIA